MRICGLGDNTVDEYVHQGLSFAGGNAVNVAVFAARQGASAAYLGVAGSDDRGRFLLEQLRQQGVDISRIRTAIGPNAHCSVAIDPDGNRRFLSFEREPEPLALSEDDIGWLRAFDLVHVGYASLLAFDLAELGRTVPLSFDFAARETDVRPALLPVLRVAAFSRSSVSVDEAITLVRSTQNAGQTTVIVTRGAMGAVIGHGDELHVQDAAPARVVDTLGAGDAFIAALLVALHGGELLPVAGRRAAVVAAAACERYGAFGDGRPIAVQEAAP